MISFANEHTRVAVWSMWKTCFGDSDEYMDIHFSRKYEDENTLLFSEEQPVASLQILPYNINFYKELIPFSYISGACTLPEARKKGYMDKLLSRSFRVMQERKIPLTILIPAEDWLFKFYERYGYAQCFEKDETPIKIKELVDKHDADIVKSFDEFQSIYSNLDFCVQKSQHDFQTIILENELAGYANEYNQSAMARIIDAEFMLTLFARHNSTKSFIVELADKYILENNKRFKIEKGTCSETTSLPDFSVSINTLAQLLFGFKTESLSTPFNDLFETHQPVINLMY